MNILKQTDLKIAVLKNEFGDSQVDSLLTKQPIKIEEIVNGCMCCVLVGQLQFALYELLKFQPQHIIIETSGSAFPAPIAWQINQLPEFKLDSIITVVDAENFPGYEDTSYTAKMQAEYTDLIIINKHDLVTERNLDLLLDKINTLNTDTPKILYKNDLELGIYFGINSQLIIKNDFAVVNDHHSGEIDVIDIKNGSVDLIEFEQLLQILDKTEVYRVKGVFPINGGKIINWAFGRYEWHSVEYSLGLRLTVMGLGLFKWKKKFAVVFKDSEINYHPRH